MTAEAVNPGQYASWTVASNERKSSGGYTRMLADSAVHFPGGKFLALGNPTSA